MNATVQISTVDITSMTLAQLAAQYNTTAAALQAANPNATWLASMGTDSAALQTVGAPYIVIPGLSDTTDQFLYYTIQRGDTVTSIATAMGLSTAQVEASLPVAYQYPAMSMSQALSSDIGQIGILNPSYPGYQVPAAAPQVGPAAQLLNVVTEPTDTLNSLAAMLGVTVYDILNNNSNLMLGEASGAGVIDASVALGTSITSIQYPNVVYAGYVPASSLTNTNDSVINVAPPQIAPITAPNISSEAAALGMTVSQNGLIQSPYMLYGAIGVVFGLVLASFSRKI